MVPVLDRQLGNGAWHVSGSSVDQNVNAAKLANTAVDGGEDVVFSSQIGRDCERATTKRSDLGGPLFEVSRGPREQHDVRSGSGQSNRRGSSEATAGPRSNGYLPVKWAWGLLQHRHHVMLCRPDFRGGSVAVGR